MCYALHVMNLEYESFTFQNKLQNLHKIFCDAPVFINFVKWDQSRLNCFFFNISNVCVYVCVHVCTCARVCACVTGGVCSAGV